MNAFTLMTRAAADVAVCTGEYDSVLSSFEREEIYQSSKQRADFMIRVCVSESDTEAHYVEMKCRSSKEADSAFVNRVKKDIDKVLNTEWREWWTSEDAFSAWVVAVSVSRGDGHLEKLMYKAGEEKGVQCQVIDFENKGNIKIWTYEKAVRGMAGQLLFGYASQKALALYAKQGEKAERPEPCIEYEGP